MDYKKSMRIFWLSLCLLLVAGTVMLAVAQYRSHKKEATKLYGKQADKERAIRMTEPETDVDASTEDVTASSFAQAPAQPEHASPDTQLQPAAGNAATYRFELKVKNGYLDVYHFHTERLFFHTGIPYSALPLKQRQELEDGKYFLDEQELYGYLESCTS